LAFGSPATLDRLIGECGKPKSIVSNNLGTELAPNTILQWADDHKVAWHYKCPRQTSAECLRGVIHRTAAR
jgi:hypothetical protein